MWRARSKKGFMSSLGDFLDKRQLRIVFVGDGGAGRTYLIEAMLDKSFPGHYISTVMEEYKMEAKIGDIEFVLSLVDFAGQEDFQIIRRASLQEMSQDRIPTVFAICFSVYDKANFENVISYWARELSEDFGKNGFLCYLLGLKDDIGQTLGSYNQETEFIDEKSQENMVKRIPSCLGSSRCSALLYCGMGEVNEERGRVEGAFENIIRSSLNKLPRNKGIFGGNSVERSFLASNIIFPPMNNGELVAEYLPQWLKFLQEQPRSTSSLRDLRSKHKLGWKHAREVLKKGLEVGELECSSGNLDGIDRLQLESIEVSLVDEV